MVDPSSEDDGSLREWAPLTAFLRQIPHKAQRGLFTGDLNLTCIAALPDYLAVGTNHGLVYWYNRVTHELQRLRCENTSCSITCIGVTSTVDYMIAAGADNGIVTVFLVPKPMPDDIPEVFKSSTKRQVERYTVGGLHPAPLSALEWSTNGMKLFSGDIKGIVVLTEIDFYMHLSKSVEVLNEKYEVAQLSYYGSQQALLVSTLYRTILCQRDDQNNVWKVTQVGNSERKVMGRMGATFYSTSHNPRAPLIYSGRPGLRVWASRGSAGIVEETLMFKDAVRSQHPLIQLLNPTKSKSRYSRGEPHIGPLLPFRERLLVTYTPDALLVLDPQTISIVAALYDVQRISALCVTKDEIFVLEGGRHLIRLGYTPEPLSNATPPEEPSPGAAITSHLLELTSKLKDASIVSAIPIQKLSPLFSPTRSSGSSDGEQVSECMEAHELPPVLSLDALDPQCSENVPELSVSMASFTLTPSEKEVFTRAQRGKGSVLHSDLLDKIGQEQFEELVFQPKKKHRRGKGKGAVVTSAGTESGSDTTSIWSETDDVWTSERMDASSEWSSISTSTAQDLLANDVLVESVPDTKETASELDDSSQVNIGDKFHKLNNEMSGSGSKEEPQRPEFLALSYTLNPDLRKQNLIEQAVAAKERMVAKKYNLEAVLGIASDDEDQAENSTVKEVDAVITKGATIAPLTNGLSEDLPVDAEENSKHRSVSIVENIDAPDVEQIQDEKMTSLSSTISYGPPSGSSQLPSRHSSLDLESTGLNEERNISTVNREAVNREAMEASGWLQFTAPEPVTWVSVCGLYLIAIDAYNTVHYSVLGGLGLKWQRADCKASQLVMSASASSVWRLQANVAFALKNPATTGPHGDEWVEAGKNIRSVALGEDVAWLVTQEGDVLCQTDLNKNNPTSPPLKLGKPCEWPAIKVAYFGQVVWVLSSTGEVYTRLGVSSVKPEGAHWRRVNIPVPGSAVDIALGAQQTGWIVDNNNTIIFSVDHMEQDPHWWQVLISDYIFQQTSPLQQLRLKMSLKNLRPALPGSQVPVTSVTSGKQSIWIFQHDSNTMHANKTRITGHSWKRVILKGLHAAQKWQTVSAEGIFENRGQLWLLSAEGDLFCSQPYNSKPIKRIPLPTSDGIVCLAAAAEALWVLLSSGDVYIRQGLSDACLEGNDWRQLSLVQIEGVHLSHVSCGCDVVWACDTEGNMYMAVSSPHDMATSTFSPVWINVMETKEQKKIFFIKVFVGSQTFMVWALDNKGRVYVREGIFPDYQLGADWVAVTGITAVDLSLSGTSVWALSTDGDVYQRHGITQNNYIGDYWKKIPGAVEALTVSMCDNLWGIDKSGSLLRHSQLTVNLKTNTGLPVVQRLPSVPGSGEDGDWEVL